MKNILFGIAIGYLGRDAIELFLKGFGDRLREAEIAREAREAEKATEEPKPESPSPFSDSGDDIPGTIAS